MPNGGGMPLMEVGKALLKLFKRDTIRRDAD
jgi:hypothetical protein